MKKIKIMLKGDHKLAEIGRAFNISPENVAEIKKGKTWRNINV